MQRRGMLRKTCRGTGLSRVRIASSAVRPWWAFLSELSRTTGVVLPLETNHPIPAILEVVQSGCTGGELLRRVVRTHASQQIQVILIPDQLLRSRKHMVGSVSLGAP